MIKMIQECLIQKQNRLNELHSYDLLQDTPEEAFDRITYIAKVTCNAQISIISFIDNHKQWIKSAQGTEVKEIPYCDSLCKKVITQGRSIEILNTTKTPDSKNNPLFARPHSPDYYFGIPIQTPSGYNIGVLSILKKNNEPLTSEQKNALQHLSSQITAQIELRKTQNLKNNTLKAYEQSLNKYALVGKFDLEGVTTYINDKFCELSKYSREEWMTHTHFIFNSDNHEAQDIDEIWKTIRSGQQWRGQFKNKNKNGEFYWTDTTITPILDHQEKIEGFVTFSYEITQEKNVEEHLQLVVSNTFDGIWDWDITKNSEYMSPRFWEILGFEAQEKKHQPSEWQKLILDEDLVTLNKNFDEHVHSRGDKPYHQEVRFRHKDGSLVWILRQGKVVEWDSCGNPTRMIGSHSDITQLKEAQSKLMYTSKMVAMGEMAGGIAHEINNPLAIINASAGTLLRKNKKNVLSSEQIEKYATQIENTVNRIAKIIIGLRNFSRDSKLDKLDICKTADIITEAQSLCTEKFKNRNIRLTTTIDQSLNISCKRVEFTQVIVNLLNNAFDAVTEFDQKDKEIHIYSGSNENSVLIYVEDSGPGVNPEVVDKIMQPFFTTKPVGKGTGLGLSISRGIIESIGGHFYLCDKSEKTRFCIELPLIPEDQLHVQVA